MVNELFTATNQFYGDLDWLELRKQKQFLLELSEITYDQYMDSNMKNIDGLIHMIDHIQDTAVDVLGLSEKDVFAYDEVE
jgi:hypothetical protein